MKMRGEILFVVPVSSFSAQVNIFYTSSPTYPLRLILPYSSSAAHLLLLMFFYSCSSTHLLYSLSLLYLYNYDRIAAAITMKWQDQDYRAKISSPPSDEVKARLVHPIC